MAADRKLDRRRDGLCAVGLRKRGSIHGGDCNLSSRNRRKNGYGKIEAKDIHILALWATSTDHLCLDS